MGLCLAGAGQPKGARLTSRPGASRRPLRSRSPSLPRALLRTPCPCLLLCCFEAERHFGYPGPGTEDATSWEVPVGICWETANGQKLGLSCWDRQNGLEISPGHTCRVVFPVSFLKPVPLWLSGQDQALLHLTFVAVDLGNCNLQDRFLPNHPQKPPGELKTPPRSSLKHA